MLVFLEQSEGKIGDLLGPVEGPFSNMMYRFFVSFFGRICPRGKNLSKNQI